MPRRIRAVGVLGQKDHGRIGQPTVELHPTAPQKILQHLVKEAADYEADPDGPMWLRSNDRYITHVVEASLVNVVDAVGYHERHIPAFL
uniref:hypothetical protein n=1 Tax=Cupriavidus taiwanensis TaxID=164546 RepID=UPI003F4999FC